MTLNTPDIGELRAIVDWANLHEDVRFLSLKYGDVELSISRDRQSFAPGAAPVAAAAPAAVAAPVAPAAPVAMVEAPAPVPAPVAAHVSVARGAELAPGEVAVTAPMVGTFYAAPKPGAAPFVQVGDRVGPDTVLCIVEVMKLMNNIEAKVSGTVARILVENEQAVEYGQTLVVIKTDG